MRLNDPIFQSLSHRKSSAPTPFMNDERRTYTESRRERFLHQIHTVHDETIEQQQFQLMLRIRISDPFVAREGREILRS